MFGKLSIIAVTMLVSVSSIIFIPRHTLAQSSDQSWPTRSVRLILPFGPGTATDVTARFLAERLAVRWGKPVIIENRPGGDGLIAISAVLSAKDDHLLLYTSSGAFLAHPYTQEKLPYVLERDFAPIAGVTDTVGSISVPASSSIKIIGDFVAMARAAPDTFNAAGPAGIGEFAIEAFLKSENIKATKVPYRDIIQAGQDLGENRIQFLLSSVAVVRPLVEVGKVRIIAIAARERSALFKDVPSVVEGGYPLLAIETTGGLYGPYFMPLELRKRIAADVIAAANEPDFIDKISRTGQDVRPDGPEEFREKVKQQVANVAAAAKILGLEMKR